MHTKFRYTIRLSWAAWFLCLAAPFAQAADQIELHVWGLNMGFMRHGWLAMVQAFEEKYPDIDVIVGPADRGQDLQKLLSGVIGNAPPDVFKREASLFGDIAARGILRPIDDFLAGDAALPDGLRAEDFSPGLLDSCRGVDGNLYGIPEGTNSLFLAYNKASFREAGLDPDRPPKTWAEWRAYTERLTQFDESGRMTRLGCLVHAPYMEDDLIFYLSMLGGKVLSDDGRTCLLDAPEALEAARFIASMYEAMGSRRAFDNFAQTQEGSTSWPFGTGKIGMTVQGDSVIGDAMRFTPDMELAIAPLPAPEGMAPITTSAKHGVYLVPGNARHPKEAWAFIRYAVGPEGSLAFFRGLRDELAAKGEAFEVYPGFRSSSKTRETVSAEFSPTKPAMREAYEQASRLLNVVRYESIPNSPVYAIVRDECLRAVDRILYGEMSAEDALADADRRIQEQLDLYYAFDAYPLLNWGHVWALAAAVVLLAVGCYWWRSKEERASTALQRHENRVGLVFISPWVFGFVVFVAGPMVFSLAMSFCAFDVIHPARFIGLGNYEFLLTKDPLFWKSLWNTAYMVLALPLGMSVALAIALLLNGSVKGMSFYRTVFYLPAITPAIATAVLWYALLNPEGLINNGLRAVGIAPPSWLGDKDWAKPAIVLMGLWGAGGGMILWLAGLQGIPRQLYEAAAIDGANKVRQFFSITLPMLTPYIFFSFVTGVIGVFQIFAQALILTKGGPADSTLFYVYYLFNNAFRYFKMGYASAMAWILFVLVLIVTLIQWRMSKRWVHYG